MYRLEGGNLLLCEVVLGQVELGVVDGKAARRALGATEERLDGKNGHAVVRSVGVLEVQVGSPVVGKVFRHLTSSAGAPLANIARHGGVEGVASDNVVHMSGRNSARLDDGVEALDGQR